MWVRYFILFLDISKWINCIILFKILISLNRIFNLHFKPCFCAVNLFFFTLIIFFNIWNFYLLIFQIRDDWKKWPFQLFIQIKFKISAVSIFLSIRLILFICLYLLGWIFKTNLFVIYWIIYKLLIILI